MVSPQTKPRNQPAGSATKPGRTFDGRTTRPTRPIDPWIWRSYVLAWSGLLGATWIRYADSFLSLPTYLLLLGSSLPLAFLIRHLSAFRLPASILASPESRRGAGKATGPGGVIEESGRIRSLEIGRLRVRFRNPRYHLSSRRSRDGAGRSVTLSIESADLGSVSLPLALVGSWKGIEGGITLHHRSSLMRSPVRVLDVRLARELKRRLKNEAEVNCCGASPDEARCRGSRQPEAA